jgi:hypothetical protein
VWDIVLWSGGVTNTHRNGCRFADIEDAGEITALVNDSHGIQRVVPTPVAVPSFTALSSAWLVCTAAVASPMCDFSLCWLEKGAWVK